MNLARLTMLHEAASTRVSLPPLDDLDLHGMLHVEPTYTFRPRLIMGGLAAWSLALHEPDGLAAMQRRAAGIADSPDLTEVLWEPEIDLYVEVYRAGRDVLGMDDATALPLFVKMPDQFGIESRIEVLDAPAKTIRAGREGRSTQFALNVKPTPEDVCEVIMRVFF